ncbi:peptidoglycan bridge formation glycyltransferase FemA/FemB family protein [Patescibacteria group bacterium]|nr:peptidoglycan bridge formation glycyltransferase FemA/FemB family protein [Patescibacteria group bacterium]
MEIKEITDKIQWENYVCNPSVGGPNTFLQSWNWGEFNRSTDCKIWRLGIVADKELIGAALVIKVSAKRGKFLFCPHGPIIEKSQIPNPKSQTNLKFKTIKILNCLFDYLNNLAKKEKVDFIRFSPLMENTPENLEIFQKYGFRDAPVHMMHPEISWLLDISKTEEEIFKGMRKTTRNLIRRAEKPLDMVQLSSPQAARGRENVEIMEVKTIEGIDEFYKLHKQTAGRHGFTPFSMDYLKKEFEALAADNQISVFFAKHGGEILSSAIIVFYGGSAFYHHGASRTSKIPASYLLLWKIIQEGKMRGCRIFNFWGIAPADKPKHPWAGLTLFKTGFGGYKEEYLHCQDLPISLKYWLNWMVEKIRRWKRGY